MEYKFQKSKKQLIHSQMSVLCELYNFSHHSPFVLNLVIPRIVQLISFKTLILLEITVDLKLENCLKSCILIFQKSKN